MTKEKIKECEICSRLNFTKAGFEIDSYGVRVIIGDVPFSKRFNFCPMCGKEIPYEKKIGK